MEHFPEETETYAVPYPVVVLLRKVQKHILEEPTRYLQSNWIEDSISSPCGTAACIAGWMVALNESETDHIPLPDVLEALKHSYGSGYIKDKSWELLGRPDIVSFTLFSPMPHAQWPEPFRTQWGESLMPKHEIAAARIEHYIRTGE